MNERARDEDETVLRPMGVLGTLSDALTAAFDHEMALWRGAAQSYEPRHATLRSRGSPHALRAIETTGDGSRDEENDIERDDDGSASADVTDSIQSRSDGVEIVGVRGDKSLAGQWAELEAVLASLQPPLRTQRRATARATPLAGPSARLQRHDIAQLRMRSKQWMQKRLDRDYDDDEDNDTVVSRDELCREAIVAWREATRASAVKRAKYQAAESHSRRFQCSSILRAWLLIGRQHRLSRKRDQHLTLAVRSLRTTTSLRQWWIASRWTRGRRGLERWANARRLERAIGEWKELVAIIRQVKVLRSQTQQRNLGGVFLRWRRFAGETQAKRERMRVVNQLIIRRYLSRLAHGTTLVREQRRRVSMVRHHRASRTCRRVFQEWVLHTDAARKTRTAIEWRRHCLLSTCFEAWNLLHRCFVYHRQRTTSARAHYAHRSVRRLFRRWQNVAAQRHKQREAMQTLIRRTLLRSYFRHLRTAVQADHDRARQLLTWKTRRGVLKWQTQAHVRNRLAVCRRAVRQLHRERVLRCVAWAQWRKAFGFTLQRKRLVQVADRNVLRKWWRRWTQFELYKNERNAMRMMLDEHWKRKQQRLALGTWRRFCDEKMMIAAKLDIARRHQVLRLLQRCCSRWKEKIKDIRTNHQHQANAQQMHHRLVLRRWQRNAYAEKLRDAARIMQVLYGHPLWLKRSWFGTWKRHVIARARCRQARLFRLWRVYASRAVQVRAAQLLGRWIQMRQMWMRWITFKATSTRTREASQQLLMFTRSRLLVRCFKNVWHVKTLRFRDARHKLQGISANVTKRIYWNRWYRDVVAAKQARCAARHYDSSLRTKCFQLLYQYCIERPRAFIRARQVRSQRRLFLAWKGRLEVRRFERQVHQQLLRRKTEQAIKMLRTHVQSRRRGDQRRWDAVVFHRQYVLVRTFERWHAFATTRANCRAATNSIISTQQRRVLARWRRALARQLFVHALETQYDQTLLRRHWVQFTQAIRTQQEARDNWLMKLTSVVQRKAFHRWQQLVETQRLQRLTADWLYVQAQRRRLQIAWDEWIHFTTMRAFVHLRARRESRVLLATTLRKWKVLVTIECRHRVREQRTMSRVYEVWKKYALVQEAARETQTQSQLVAVSAAWKTWRVEFWIRQSQATAHAELLRRCLHAWRASLAAERERVVQPRPVFTTRRATAFDEAMILQHIAQHQRHMARRVLHAWALAAQTCKRQRRKELPRRGRDSVVASFKSFDPKWPSKRDGSMDGERFGGSFSPDEWDQENVNPNTRPASRDTPIPWSREEAELVALEFWSSRVLKAAFNNWRGSVERRT